MTHAQGAIMRQLWNWGNPRPLRGRRRIVCYQRYEPAQSHTRHDAPPDARSLRAAASRDRVAGSSRSLTFD